jgi:hypothetical protein
MMNKHEESAYRLADTLLEELFDKVDASVEHRRNCVLMPLWCELTRLMVVVNDCSIETLIEMIRPAPSEVWKHEGEVEGHA